MSQVDEGSESTVSAAAAEPRAQETPIPVICVGLGAIGTGVAELCARNEGFEVVAAVDPVRAGQQIAGVTVAAELGAVEEEAAVAVLSTTSDLQLLYQQAEPILARGANVVSTCEDLAYPWATDPDAAEKLDRAARAAGRAVAGAGVNPGLTMEYLPVVLASACAEVEQVDVSRHVNLGNRRRQLKEKLGIGLGEEQWHDQDRERGLGHRGLVASAQVCAVGLGWDVEALSFAREPRTVDGAVSEVREQVELDAGEGRRLTLSLSFGEQGDSVDEVRIGNGPTMRVEGLNGDEATAARALSAARAINAAPSGLRLPIELAPWFVHRAAA